MVSIPADEDTKKIEIEIIEDNEWEPDKDFFVELYDVKYCEPIEGDDARATITILDDDFPGILSFDITQTRVVFDDGKVELMVKRSNGSDGVISCVIKTEDLAPGLANNAKKDVDYTPISETITFQHGECD